ncbi:MAG: spermidine/putrescine ABC transporter substrate-binding protein [Actinomycetota bacterium]|nr:spermidine/putrescine ABC transporter substrate-binding protein [Actinomycetota bacterium]MDH5223281.1 spermidine/putrescine ABC transporter substrate-binding protein [Actinomycetota bacterium]MDH5313485.1 spermidine/putrescine ABC transporter substrate-binding protein [Actinomycetota bacterium]
MENRWSRRQFIGRAAGGAIAVPSLAAILAACAKPGTTESGGGSAAAVGLARPDNPVELPLNGDPIAASTPIEEGATLQVYNWDAYMYKKVLKAFEEEYGVTIEWTTFNNMEEGIQKLVSGQIQPDVFFPTTDYIARLVESDLIQPLNLELVPNLASNVWQSFSDPGPFYDLGARYTVPYTIYTTGVAYRRDRVDDADASAQGYDLLWNPDYTGEIAYYDSYRDAIGMALVRNGVMDPNTGDPASITAAKDSILEIINDLDGQLRINGTFAKLPEGEFTVSQSWSGDIVGAKWYLPKGTGEDVLGYWYPEGEPGLIGNDTIVIPTTAQSPRLAHEFLNFFLDEQWGYTNFADWNGYQPPFTTIDPDSLIADGVVAPQLNKAVVTEEMFTTGLVQSQLAPEVDQLWLDAWSEIQAGG